MTGELVMELLKISFIFIALLGGLLVVLKLLKSRIIPSKGMLRIVHYQPLGPKRGVAVVKVMKDYLLLGMTDVNISLIARLNASDVEQYLLEAGDNRLQSDSYSFDRISSRLRGIFRREG
ncbi:MAG: flagellar biosynthetic protein FliO [Dissulfurispiraceae bacterium]|jgi:flagellar biogenesis protein FliO|nr:flagellar biosynthetic protein FliO [Dissulfurispiraceae bacterium]